MAAGKKSVSSRGGLSKATHGSDSQRSSSLLAGSQDAGSWMDTPLAASRQAADLLGQFQRVMQDSLLSWNQSLTSGISELCQAKAPAQVRTTESGGLSRQIDALAAQQAGLMQLVLDSQLTLFYSLLDGPERVSPPANNGKEFLSALGHAQDAWLQFTGRIIESAKSSQSDS